jgi:hypothetical protein
MYVINKKLPTVNDRPIVENSPNLVTLNSTSNHSWKMVNFVKPVPLKMCSGIPVF